MLRKWVVGAVAVIACVSLGGVGFAVFTSTASVVVTGQAGNLIVEWVGPSQPAPVTSNAYVVCQITLTPSAITWTMSALAPGDFCTLPASDGVELSNIGNLPASLAAQAFGTSPPGCGLGITYNYGPAVLPNSPAPPAPFATLAAGTMAPPGGYTATIDLPMSVGDSCESGTTHFTLYINATAGP